MKPIVKWVGGKRRFVDALVPNFKRYLKNTGGTYYEPFLGGGAMALALGWDPMVLGDANEELIQCYRNVRDMPEGIAFALSDLALNVGIDRESYLFVRDGLKPRNPGQAAARFLYLNKLCFNGIYRVNRNGWFNVPYGDIDTKRPLKEIFPSMEQMRQFSKVMGAASLRATDFEEIIQQAGAGDLIYADPPYDGTYDSYTSEGFDQHDQWRLARCLLDAHKRGAVIVSHNSNTSFIRGCYSWANIRSVDEFLAVSRGNMDCVIVATKPSLLDSEASG